MNDSVQNSSLAPRPVNKSHMTIDGPTYMGLELHDLDVGDSVMYMVKGEVKEKRVNHDDKTERTIEIVVNYIQDMSPKKGLDETNRLT